MNPLLTKLRRAYRDSGLTFQQIAAKAEVHENTVYALMSGRNIRTSSLFAVCRVLGVDAVPVPSSSSSTSCDA